MKLSAREIKEFFQVGYIIKKNLFLDEEIEKMAQAFDKLQQAAAQFQEPTLYKNSQFVVHGQRIDRIVWACGFEPSLKDFARDARLTTPCAQLLGQN